MANLTIKQLRYFDALAQHGHFGRAADACAISQPALSMRIKELEEELGTPLVERGPRQLRLTPFGEDFVAKAREVLRGVDELGDLARAAKGRLAGRLRIGVIPTIAPYLLPRLAPEAHRRYPELRLMLREGQTHELVEQLHEHKLDLLLLALDVDTGGAEEHFLFDDPFVLAVPEDHPFAKRKSVKKREIDQLELLLLEDGHCLRDHAFSACSLDPSKEMDDFRATSMNTLVHMVANGIGATLLPGMAVTGELRKLEGMRILPFSDSHPGRRIGLAWRRSTPRKEEFHLMAELLLLVADGIY